MIKVFNGDLVKVVYLDKCKYHFDVQVGVACKKDGRDFFIAPLWESGYPDYDRRSGWYSPEEVEVLVEDYFHRGVIKGGYEELIKDAQLACEALGRCYSQLYMEKLRKVFKC